MTRDELIKKIERCSAHMKLKPSVIGVKAVGNQRVYEMLVAGRPGPGIDTVNKLNDWLDDKLRDAP